jgi:hypothetical protein
MNEFFEHLGRQWVEAAGRRDATIAAPTLDSRVALELLELARVAAHTRERRFAPLSCYLAGVAAERLRSQRPGTDDAAVAAFIEEVRHALEAEAPPEPASGR